MIVAIMQPYFLPYIGYWQLLNAVDTFVLFDDVNYIKRGWINRNRLLENGKAAYFNIIIQSASQNRHINDTYRLLDENEESKLLRRITTCYHKAPYFEEIYPLINAIVMEKENKLSKYLETSICMVAEYLQIKTTICNSSDVKKNEWLCGQDKIIDICKRLGADTYYNPIGGLGLYDKSVFQKENIRLFFLESENIHYLQFGDTFVPSLSIMDVLMFCGKERTRQFLERYRLK
ncbi:WbqC family protein [Candidatus Acetatifactor stercoripullorum]|uniref:WbqC family protein n=1 Tax=Candidatus Acetatifactor stercoripullorum TaxID=2838414 RepID=UPI00298D65B8|nr:WbqC family protein [Candidatus Acetatifactor stercoripullorum]